MTELLRSYIRNGDTTTAHGRVEVKPQTCSVTYGDQHACFEGDAVWCPACNSYGVTKCVPPFRKDTGPDGRQTNLDGDLCLCKCPRPPRLVALHHNHAASFEGYEIAGMLGSSASLTYAGHSKEHVAYDEQVHLKTMGAVDIGGLPYFVELADGRTLVGTVEDNGEFPRIETPDEAQYTVFWGDEALSKQQEAAA